MNLIIMQQDMLEIMTFNLKIKKIKTTLAIHQPTSAIDINISHVR